MRERLVSTEHLGSIIDKAAKEAEYSDGFGIQGWRPHPLPLVGSLRT